MRTQSGIKSMKDIENNLLAKPYVVELFIVQRICFSCSLAEKTGELRVNLI